MEDHLSSGEDPPRGAEAVRIGHVSAEAVAAGYAAEEREQVPHAGNTERQALHRKQEHYGKILSSEVNLPLLRAKKSATDKAILESGVQNGLSVHGDHAISVSDDTGSGSSGL